MGREPGIGPAQLTCPNTDTDHSEQTVPVLFAPLFFVGRAVPQGGADPAEIPRWVEEGRQRAVPARQRPLGRRSDAALI